MSRVAMVGEYLRGTQPSMGPAGGHVTQTRGALTDGDLDSLAGTQAEGWDPFTPSEVVLQETL